MKQLFINLLVGFYKLFKAIEGKSSSSV